MQFSLSLRLPRLLAYFRAIKARRILARMDDRMLSDIGISRAQAEFEANRKPWGKAK